MIDKENGLKLAPILCNGMILQRDTQNLIYGIDSLSKTIVVEFMNQEYHSQVKETGEFSIELPPISAGGPYEMYIKGSSEIILSDIWFGDVFILSGQSNMELPIRRVLDVSAEEIGNTYEPEIRQYLIPATYNFSEPEEYMYAGAWKKAVDHDLMEFSALGYFFAKEIKDTFHVPVGLIQAAVGGSKIESWMKPDTLKRFGDYEGIIEEFKNLDYFHSFLMEQQNAANEWLIRLEEEEYAEEEKEKFMEEEKECFSAEENYKEWHTCNIPSLVSDYSEKSFCGSVYLSREVILNSAPEDSFLYMGSIIDADKIWINGELIGSTEYRYPPRKYKIPRGILKKGSNHILVRIIINNKNGGTIKGKPYYLFCDGEKYTLEGKWFYKIGKRAEEERPSVLFPPILPVCFYNTVVAPLSKIAVKGIAWYQGESNTEAPKGYAEKFAAMVSDWRDFLRWEVPFLYVQLSNYREPLNTTEDTGWALLRDEQRKNLSLSKTAMVVTLDIGESNDLHPQNKKEVGMRLAKAAGYIIYNKEQPYSGPIPENVYVEGSSDDKHIKISFLHLEDTDTEYNLNNFEVAASDGMFYEAVAKRKGKNVFVYPDKMGLPSKVRYAWRDAPRNINFYNDAGLPATGFELDIPQN
jgi:sialate O-acetylesterase